MAQLDPAEFFRSRLSMPSGLGSKELARLDPLIRQRAFFSAKVECGELLDGIRKFVQECIAEGTTEGEFLHRVNQWLWENAQFLGEDFPNAKVRSGEWGDEEARRYERSVRHIDSLARLRLIFRTQAEMCAGFSDFRRDMEPQALADYPGWKFVRNPGAKTFRKDHVEHQGEVRLKTDFDYWLARNDPSFGGFNNPYPPFGFNSWMWTSPVSRAKCVRLGLIAEGEEVSLSDGQRRQWGLDGQHAVEAIQKMLDRLCKYPQEEPDGLEDGELEEPEPLCKDWGGIPEDMQREIVETVKEMNEKYDAGIKEVEIYIEDPNRDDIFAISEGHTIYVNEGYDELKGGMAGLENITLHPPDDNGFTRRLVGCTPSGCTARSVIFHETGHHICYRDGVDVGRTDPDVYKELLKACTTAMKNGDIKRISEYSADNAHEFFAECFAARELGETLPDYMIDMLDKVYKMTRRKGENN